MPRTEYRQTVIKPTLRFMIAGLVLSCTATLPAQDSTNKATEAEDSMSERPRRVRPDVGDADQNPRHGGRFDGRRAGMADRLLGRGDGGESRGRGIPRTISEKEFKRMIEIGKRISPEMSAALEKQWVENREGLSADGGYVPLGFRRRAGRSLRAGARGHAVGDGVRGPCLSCMGRVARGVLCRPSD